MFGRSPEGSSMGPEGETELAPNGEGRASGA